MIVTPPTFRPLGAPVACGTVKTFAFRGSHILIRERDLALPDVAVCDSLGVAQSNVFPVGLLGEDYCRAAWLAGETIWSRWCFPNRFEPDR